MPKTLGRQPKKLQDKTERMLKPKVCIVESVPKTYIYPTRLTRSLLKKFKQTKNFIIIEVYRCMPLLGDEEKQAPDWTVHIVRYDIVFVDP